MTSNELRSEIGLKPSDAANAEELRNPNLNASDQELEQRYGDSAQNGESEDSVSRAVKSLSQTDTGGYA